MKKLLAILLAVAMVFTVAAFSVSAADADVAAIGDVTYETLAYAIAAATPGDKITLLADVNENVTISKKLTLDGADKQYTGKITLGKAAVTIENVDFVSGNIYKNKKTGVANTVTVKNCDFDGQGLNDYAVNLGAVNYIVIEDCTAKNYGYGFLQVPSTNDSVTVKNVDVSNVNYAFKIDYSNGVSMENVTVKNAKIGIYNSNYGAKTYTIKNCDFDADAPIKIWERNSTVYTTFIFKGENNVGDDLTFGSELVKTVADVAKIGTETYATIRDAVAAADDGDVITVIYDHTLANDDLGALTSGMYPYIDVTDKKVTIDLNGKTISVNPDNGLKVLAVFSTGNTGELTLKDSSEDKTGTVKVTMAEDSYSYSMITALGSSKLNIESGNYTIDRVDSQSMIYAGQTEQITVSGGSFVLGNAKTRDPGNGEMQPWIFNAHGDGLKVITVTGGTYNVDPTHYHGEASFPGCYTPVENEDSTWTVTIVHTPGDAATCQAPQICTVCETELDAIKPCSFENYVSDDNATCQADGTKTAECIYGCGATDTVTDEGTKGTHADKDGDGNCDGCDAEFCKSCGKIHKDWMSLLFCLIVDFIKLVVSFVTNVL